MPRFWFALLLALTPFGCANIADSSTSSSNSPNKRELKPPAAPPREDLAIIGATVIDVVSGGQIADATVLVKDGRIEKVTVGGPPAGYREVDASGKFLIPGLWDMHVHWFHPNSMGLFLANGVTGVRMMSGAKGHFDWRREFQTGEFATPRLYLGSRIVDGPRPVRPNSSHAVSSPEQGREIVRQLEQEGWDFLKIYQLVERDSYLAILDEAQKLKLPVHGHLPNGITLEEALNAGQVTFEHMMSSVVERYGSSSDKKALLDLWKSKGAFASPTLAVVRVRGHWRTDEYENNPELRFVPQSIRQSWPQTDPQRRNEKSADEFEAALSIVGALHDAGIPILAGSDCYMNRLVPGFSLHDELRLLVQAGLTPLEAIQAATRNAALLMGKRDVGVIDTGALADLVLLDANPLEDIRNTEKVFAVVSDGRYYDRAELDALLEHAEKAAPSE